MPAVVSKSFLEAGEARLGDTLNRKPVYRRRAHSSGGGGRLLPHPRV